MRGKTRDESRVGDTRSEAEEKGSEFLEREDEDEREEGYEVLERE